MIRLTSKKITKRIAAQLHSVYFARLSSFMHNIMSSFLKEHGTTAATAYTSKEFKRYYCHKGIYGKEKGSEDKTPNSNLGVKMKLLFEVSLFQIVTYHNLRGILGRGYTQTMPIILPVSMWFQWWFLLTDHELRDFLASLDLGTQITRKQHEHTLPESNSVPLKMDDWKTSFLLERPIFKGKLLVSGRVDLESKYAKGQYSTELSS